MTILLFLAPASLMLALIGLGAFLWTVQSILLGADDDRPLPDAPPADEAPRP